jgi:ferredoxin
MIGTFLLIIVGIILVTGVAFWIIGERGRLLRISTWNFIREAGLKRLLNLSNIHAYVYGRWIKEYLSILNKHIIPHLNPRGKRWLSNRYHGKVITKEQAKNIITINKDIPLQNLDQIIPYSMARDLVLKGPPDVVVFQCGCRQSRDNPCQPIEVCMVIGQPFTNFVLEHHPKTSRRLTQTEALELLEAEHERGHLHSAWFKDAMLDRFYSICNCCKCCCGGLEAMVKYGVPMMASSGYVCEISEDCNGCGECADYCHFEAISVNGKAVVDYEKCMGCGLCESKCPLEAISLKRDPAKGEPFDIKALSESI